MDSVQTDNERMAMELEKTTMVTQKQKEDYKRLHEECHQVQEAHDRAALQLARAQDAEAKYKDDFDRASYDLNMLRERSDKAQSELVKLRAEKEKGRYLFDVGNFWTPSPPLILPLIRIRMGITLITV